MDNINDLLNSISAEDMEKLKNAASALISKGNQENIKASEDNSGDMVSLVMQLASGLNRENDKTAFLKALRPLLSEERQQKADEAMKFLRLMDTLPLLKGLF